jgi:hypothetical protein
MISLNRVQKLLTALIGRVISEATFLGYIMLVYVALEKWEAIAVSKILKLPCIHSDETSMRVDKKNYWVHTTKEIPQYINAR